MRPPDMNPTAIEMDRRAPMAGSLKAIEDETGHTPLARLDLRQRGAWSRMWLKLEWCNPNRSIKDRTAMGLLGSLHDRGLLTPRTRLVESTSGNLGVALAAAARRLGVGFIAVVDPKASPQTVAAMRSAGARVDVVHDTDLTGGYLHARLARVQALLADGDEHLVWPDQYHNPAGPRIHYRTTAPEIYRQMRGRVDAVVVAVSTGGTMAGIARYFRLVSPHTRLVAVDAFGSVAVGGPPGVRDLTGIGASLPSSLLAPDDVDERIWVRDVEAFATCLVLRERCGISVGGSSGAVIHAAARYRLEHPDAARLVCVLADDGAAYADSIYRPEWLAARGHRVDAEELPMADALLRPPGQA